MPAQVRRLVMSVFAGFAVLMLIGASPAPDASTPPPAVSSPASTAPVEIFDVTVSPDPVRANASASVMIHTTPNVVSIGIKVIGHTFIIPKTGDGVFFGAGKVPWWARFFHGAFSVMFIATGPNGATAEMNQTVRM